MPFSDQYPRDLSFIDKVGTGILEPKYILVNKFGRNEEVDTTSDPEDVWDGGGLYNGQPVSDSETVLVVSSSAADTAAGTGARTVQIEGLDANWGVQTEIITMAGATPVESVGTYRRVNRAFVVTGGSGGANAGTITINHSSTTANVFGVMAIGFNQSQIACYTIPGTHRGHLVATYLELTRASGADGSATISLRVRDTASADAVYRAREIYEMSSGGPHLRKLNMLRLDPKTDIIMRADVVSDNDSIINASFVILLEQL